MDNLGLTDSMPTALNPPTISAREFPRMTPPSVEMVSLGKKNAALQFASGGCHSTPQLQTRSQRLQITVMEGASFGVASVGVVDISVRFERRLAGR